MNTVRQSKLIKHNSCETIKNVTVHSQSKTAFKNSVRITRTTQLNSTFKLPYNSTHASDRNLTTSNLEHSAKDNNNNEHSKVNKHLIAQQSRGRPTNSQLKGKNLSGGGGNNK